VQEYEIDRSQTLNQSVSLNIAPKLGYITISPFVDYNDQRSFSNNDIPARRDTTTNELTFINKQNSTRFGEISSGVSMSTKLYGIVQPGFFGIEAIRHTISPSLSLSYNKQIIGDDLPPKQMLLSFTLGNVFDMKTVSHEEGKEGNKIQLLNIDGAISYNFSADSLNFSPIALSYRTGIGDVLNLYGSMGMDLYKFQVDEFGAGRRINEFSASDGPLARLTDFSIDASTTLAGDRKSSSAQSAPSEVDTTQPQPQTRKYYGMYHEEDPDFSIPWRLGLSMNYSENFQPGSQSRASTVHGNLEFNLTEAWKFTASGGYDIINKEVVVPNITISRDLHCWLMNFIWVPLGNAKSFQFELRVKAPQLRDLKLTKSGSDRGYYSN
jgi:hypothetical protein